MISQGFIRSSLIVCSFTFICCGPRQDFLYERILSSNSGIQFENRIVESPEMNILTYEYTYNGGGVAAADFNNDGLCDLYFSGNAVSNKLYLNLGNLKFKDVTEQAGVQDRKLWKTGVAAADVNGDGWLDIYVCYSGPNAGQSLSNQLFINNGPDQSGLISFTERGEEYGIDAPGTYSTQASFFDYDKDGDLDMFLVNHGNHFYSPFVNTNKLRTMRHPEFGNRLYRNDGINLSRQTTSSGQATNQPHFTEVSQEAGIHGGGINFGLGVSISDVNNDGWPDIFVTNDYEEQDFLYLNNQDGTFRDCTKESFGHFSRNGMGTDIADYNNDRLPDIIEVDMWPEDNYRQKLLRGPDDYNRYQLMVDSGFHYQQMRNTLQLNMGQNERGIPLFSEVGQMACISSTDWSWAPLFFDADNDGYKDLFISNGYLRDFTSMDFLKYTVEDAKLKATEQGVELQLYDLVSKMPSTKTRDYIFRNNHDLTFTDFSSAWGIDVPNLSFGAAYADLDNDGDLELIVNGTNEVVTIWENKQNEIARRNFLKVKLIGPAGNPFAIGTKVFVESETLSQMQEQFPVRGFQSSVDPVLHFGLGDDAKINSVTVLWPDNRKSALRTIKVNQLIEINHSSSLPAEKEDATPDKDMFIDVSKQSGIDFLHRENAFVDFDREPLIPYQLSRSGPAIAKADVNNDGNDDFYIGGAIHQSGQLYLADSEGHFIPAAKQPWEEDKEREDTGAVFFDADGDGDMDLFVVSGGNEYLTGSENLDDRLYLNEGNGWFTKCKAGVIPDHSNGSCVTAGDYDQDGDVDLFVGGHSKPGSFPVTSPGAILKNETNRAAREIKFTVATMEVNTELREPGMVTDAAWCDFNNDSWLDLIVVGQWMPVKVYKNDHGKLQLIPGFENTHGLWTRIAQADYDQDGDLDFVIGNAGLNLPWKVSPSEPLRLYATDLNNDSQIDPIITYINAGAEYPIASRDELLQQVNSLRPKFQRYDQYARATIQEIFGKEASSEIKPLIIRLVETGLIENLGNDKFSLMKLPIETQVSCSNGVLISDFNGDGMHDILLSGNYFPFRTQVGRSDAGKGLLLSGEGNKVFEVKSWPETGFLANGDVRNMVSLKSFGKEYILVVRNNDSTSLFKVDN